MDELVDMFHYIITVWAMGYLIFKVIAEVVWTN